MKIFHEMSVRARESIGVQLEAGCRIRITDPVGGQVGTLTAFAEPADGKEYSWIASFEHARANRSAKLPGFPSLLEGDLLIANDGTPIMRITADTMEIKGIQNMHTVLCNRESKALMSEPDRDYCYEAAYRAAEPWGLKIPVTETREYVTADHFDRLDLFAKPQILTKEALAKRKNPADRVVIGGDGQISDLAVELEKSDTWQTLGESASRPGDYLEFEALTECLVTCANCIRGGDNAMKVEFLE